MSKFIVRVDKDNKPNSTGMWYVISPPDSKFAFYMNTRQKSKKIRNIMQNPNVSFIVPFPHHFLRIIPSSTIEFRGIAKVLPLDSAEAISGFNEKYLLRKGLEKYTKEKQDSDDTDNVFVKIIPNNKVFCFGIGLSLLELKNNHEKGIFTVLIPSKRL